VYYIFSFKCPFLRGLIAQELLLNYWGDSSFIPLPHGWSEIRHGVIVVFPAGIRRMFWKEFSVCHADVTQWYAKERGRWLQNIMPVIQQFVTPELMVWASEPLGSKTVEVAEAFEHVRRRGATWITSIQRCIKMQFKNMTLLQLASSNLRCQVSNSAKFALHDAKLTRRICPSSLLLRQVKAWADNG